MHNQPVSRAQFTKSFLGDDAAARAGSIGERLDRHAVALTSRRWPGGHDNSSGGDAPRQFDLCTVHDLPPQGLPRRRRDELQNADFG